MTPQPHELVPSAARLEAQRRALLHECDALLPFLIAARATSVHDLLVVRDRLEAASLGDLRREGPAVSRWLRLVADKVPTRGAA